MRKIIAFCLIGVSLGISAKELSVEEIDGCYFMADQTFTLANTRDGNVPLSKTIAAIKETLNDVQMRDSAIRLAKAVYSQPEFTPEEIKALTLKTCLAD